MNPNYANALVQRYMRSSLAGEDTSDTHSSPSPSAGAAARAGRASVTTATSTQQQQLKRDSSVSKRASRLIRAADSSSDDEQVAPPRDRANSPSFARMQQQQPRTSSAAGWDSKSAGGNQSILHRRSSHTSGQQQQASASRASSPPRFYNSAADVTQRSSQVAAPAVMPHMSESMAAAAAGSLRAPAGMKGQSLIDARAEQTLPAGHRSSTPGRHPARSLAYGSTAGFEFPTHWTSSIEEPVHNHGRNSVSMTDWQQQEQQTVSAAAAEHVRSGLSSARASAASATGLLPVPPSQSLPPPGVLSPRSSAMQALQKQLQQHQDRPSAARSEPGGFHTQSADVASNVDMSRRSTTPASAGQQLRDISSSAAAAIERARRTTAAAVAGAAHGGRVSVLAARSSYRQHAPGIANLGGPGLPPPNSELAKEAAVRARSPSPGRRSISPGRPPASQPGLQTAPAAAAEDGSSSESGVDDSALRDMPGYGNRSRSRSRAAKQGRSSAPDNGRNMSATGAATAEAMAVEATAALGGRHSSHHIAQPLELAASVVSRRMSSAFAAAQAAAAEETPTLEAEATQSTAAAAAGMQPRLSSPGLAAVRQEAVAASRAAKRASLIAQQQAAEERELFEQEQNAWLQQQLWQQQQQQQRSRPDSAALGRSEHHTGSSCSGSMSDDEDSEQQEGDSVWRQVQRNTRQGWFQSPERLRKNHLQQHHHANAPAGRYYFPSRASRWAPWYEDERQPQQHRHQRQSSPMRMRFKLPAASPAVRASAAAAAAEAHDAGLQDAPGRVHKSRARPRRGKGKTAENLQRQQPGEQLYKQLLTESIEQPLDTEKQGRSSSSRPAAAEPGSGSEDAAAYKGGSSSASGDGLADAMALDAATATATAAGGGAAGTYLVGEADAETGSSHGGSEPSLRALQRNSKQQRGAQQQLLEQKQHDERRRREQRKQRRVATAAALQAANRAASPERRHSVASGRASPDAFGTAIEAAMSSAAAAEVVRHTEQQKHQAGHPTTHVSRSAASMVTSQQLRKEAAEEALHRARLAQLLAGGTRDLRPSSAATPYTEASRGRRYARPSTARSPSPAAASHSTIAGYASGTHWQYRSLSAGRQYDEQYNITPPRMSAAARGAASFSVGEINKAAEPLRRSTAGATGRYRHRESLRSSTELYARPASSLATYNVHPPASFSMPGSAPEIGLQAKQQLRASYDGLAAHGPGAHWASLTDNGWQQQQRQDQHHHGQQQQQRVQPLALAAQKDAAPTVQSVAENLQNLMQRVAETLGTRTAEVAATGATNVAAPARHYQNTPVSPQPLNPNAPLRHEDITHWPLERRNISQSRDPSPTSQHVAGSSPHLAQQQQQRQQQLPQHSVQQQGELSFELSYADNLRQQGNGAMPQQASSSKQSQQQQQQQQQQLELVAPLNYLPRHKVIDAAVTGRPPSPLWNQMHVAQRRLHELQQEQQAVLQQLQQQRSPSPQRQQQRQHENDLYGFGGHTSGQAVSAAADRQTLAPAPSPPAVDAADLAGVHAAAGCTESNMQTVAGSRNRASLIPVEQLVAAMQILQVATQQQQQQSPVGHAGTTVHGKPLPLLQDHMREAEHPTALGAGVLRSQSPNRRMAPQSPSSGHACAGLVGVCSPAANTASASPEDLQRLLAGVVGSVQGLDTMMSSLLAAARARSPSTRQQHNTDASYSGVSSGDGPCQQVQEVHGADEADTVNFGSVLPPQRYRQASTGSLTPEAQQQQQWGLLDVAPEGSPVRDVATAQTPSAAVAAAAVSVRQVMDQLCSSAMAAWQAEEDVTAAAARTGDASPEQQQQLQGEAPISGLQRSPSPAIKQNNTGAQGRVPYTAGAAGTGQQTAVPPTAAASSAAAPAELLQQLGALESQLIAVQQHMLGQQQQQREQVAVIDSGGFVRQQDHHHHHQQQQQQATDTQAQQLAEQLTQLQDRLVEYLTGDRAAAAAAHQHGPTDASAKQQQQQQVPTKAPAALQLLKPVEAMAALSRPGSSASILSPKQRTMMSSLPAVSPVPSPSRAIAAAAAAVQDVSRSPVYKQAAVDSAVRKSLAESLAAAAAASPALRASNIAASIPASESLSPERLTTTAAAAMQQMSRGISPIGHGSPIRDQQLLEQVQERQGQQAALQLELPQASAEAQLVMNQQVNELHAGLRGATDDICSLQQSLKQLEVQQQQQQVLPQQELLLQIHAQQQQLQDLQQQLLQLQQAGNTAAAADGQLEWQQNIQDRLQELQQQQAGTALKIETQAAAVTAAAVDAAAAATEQQLEPLKQQLQKLETAHQELLERSRVLNSAAAAAAAAQDTVADDRLDVLEGRCARQGAAVEVLTQQLAGLKQQLQQQSLNRDAADAPQDSQQQQLLLLQETVEQLTLQLRELQQELQHHKQKIQDSIAVSGGDISAAAAAAAGTAASASKVAAEGLQQQVQQLELKVAQLQVQQQQREDDAHAVDKVASLQQQLQLLSSSVEQLQLQQHTAAAQADVASLGSIPDASQAAAATAAAAENAALHQQLQLLGQRVNEMAVQLHECNTAAAIALPLRLVEVEERVAATAQTCADAVKVIALKHASISAMFAEVQASQAAADNRLAQLSKQLSSMKERRGSRGNSRAGSRTVSSTGVV